MNEPRVTNNESRSPWDDVRAQCPDMILLRVICVDAGAQTFVEIPRTEKNLAAGAEVYDHATVFRPELPEGYSAELRAAIIRTADAAWHSHHDDASA